MLSQLGYTAELMNSESLFISQASRNSPTMEWSPLPDTMQLAGKR